MFSSLVSHFKKSFGAGVFAFGALARGLGRGSDLDHGLDHGLGRKQVCDHCCEWNDDE